MPPSETVVLSVPTHKAKNILDTRLYQALRERYKVIVISYLADRPGTAEQYGGPNVIFESEAQPRGRVGNLLARVLEAARGLGYQYGRRRDPWIGTAWRATYRFRDLDDHEERGRIRKLLVFVIAVIWQSGRAWRLFAKVTAGLVVDQRIEALLKTKRPIAMIVSGQGRGTFQEMILGMSARRLGIPSIWIPVSPDDVMYNGYMLAPHRLFCAWGGEMRRQLEVFHGVDPDRILDTGNVMTRLQMELMEASPDYDVRLMMGIPADMPMIVYFSVVNSAATQTIAAVDAMAQGIEDGSIPRAIILLRTSPAEDPTGIANYYADNPHVRVQHGPWQRFDDLGTSVFTEHAWTIKQSNVLVVGSPTSALFQAAAWDIPAIVNVIESGEYLEDAWKPSTCESIDLNSFFSDGLKTSHSFEELTRHVSESLNKPKSDLEVSRRISARWDYPSEGYVDSILSALTNMGDSALSRGLKIR